MARNTAKHRSKETFPFDSSCSILEDRPTAAVDTSIVVTEEKTADVNLLCPRTNNAAKKPEKNQQLAMSMIQNPGPHEQSFHNDHHNHNDDDEDDGDDGDGDSSYEEESPPFRLSLNAEGDEFNYSSIAMGSFAISVRPIDLIDEHGNLPLTNVTCILPAVVEEEEDEDDDFLPPTCTNNKSEEETLSTTATECTASSRYLDTFHSTTNIDHYQGSNDSSRHAKDEIDQRCISDRHVLETIHSMSTAADVMETREIKHKGKNEDALSKDDSEQMRAIWVMKDVIFRQRSALKNISKDKVTLQNKYLLCKLQNKNLMKENKQIKNDLKKMKKTNGSLERELEKLRAELQDARKTT